MHRHHPHSTHLDERRFLVVAATTGTAFVLPTSSIDGDMGSDRWSIAFARRATRRRHCCCVLGWRILFHRFSKNFNMGKTNHSTSDAELNAYYRHCPKYGGCFSKDQLSNKKPNGKFYIVNMQSSRDGSGTHWCVVSDLQPECCLYIDPYGIAPPPETLKFMQRSKKMVKFNHSQLQELTSTNCGEFCVYAIDKLLLKHVFDEGLTTHPSAANEREADKYFPLLHSK
jgi:hypothetical protein